MARSKTSESDCWTRNKTAMSQSATPQPKERRHTGCVMLFLVGSRRLVTILVCAAVFPFCPLFPNCTNTAAAAFFAPRMLCALTAVRSLASNLRGLAAPYSPGPTVKCAQPLLGVPSPASVALTPEHQTKVIDGCMTMNEVAKVSRATHTHPRVELSSCTRVLSASNRIRAGMDERRVQVLQGGRRGHVRVGIDDRRRLVL